MKISIIDKVKADLAYRTPTGDKPLGHIVLTRAQAEQLVTEFERLGFVKTRESHEYWRA